VLKFTSKGGQDLDLKRIQNSRWWDFAAAMPVFLLCLFGAAGFGIQIIRQWYGNTGSALIIASEVTGAIFLLFQAGLLCVRRLPVAKAAGLAPRVWALIGANFTYLLVLVPKATPIPALAAVSNLLMLVGTTGSVFTLFWLGKSFAILPQARKLVTGGPYKWVRHPLYLAEQISGFGLALQYQQPWALLLVLIGFIVQFPRMSFEEAVLEESDLAYHSYKMNTARILPFIY